MPVYGNGSSQGWSNPTTSVQLGHWNGVAPFPGNTRVAVLGDSIPYGNSFDDGNGLVRYYGKGYVNWAAYLGRQRWTFDNQDNFGVFGNDTGQVLLRAQAALAVSTAGTFILDCLTNDGPHQLTVAQSQINYRALIDMIVGAGRICICIPPRPRDITAANFTLSTQQEYDHLSRHEFVMGLADRSRGIYVCDMWRYLADPNSNNMAMKTNYTYDGVHPAPMGGYYSGLALAQILGLGFADGLFPYRDVMVGQNTDIFNSTYGYLRGCVNSNPMMQGGGAAATGWTVSGGSGVTATGSSVTSTYGNPCQQIVLSGTASANADIYDFYQTINTANLNPGDTVRAFADVEVDSMSGYTAWGIYLVDAPQFSKTSGFLTDSGDSNTISATFPAHSGVLRTPLFTCPSSNLRFALKGRSINGQAVSATYRVNSMQCRKIIPS